MDGRHLRSAGDGAEGQNPAYRPTHPHHTLKGSAGRPGASEVTVDQVQQHEQDGEGGEGRDAVEGIHRPIVLISGQYVEQIPANRNAPRGLGGGEPDTRGRSP